MTTAKIIPLPLKMKERRAAIQQALREAGWIRALNAIEQATDQAFYQGDIEAACNLIDVANMVKEKLKGEANG